MEAPCRAVLVVATTLQVLGCERVKSDCPEEPFEPGTSEAGEIEATPAILAIDSELCREDATIRNPPRLEIIEAALPSAINGWDRLASGRETDSVGQPVAAYARYISTDGWRSAEIRVAVEGSWTEPSRLWRRLDAPDKYDDAWRFYRVRGKCRTGVNHRSYRVAYQGKILASGVANLLMNGSALSLWVEIEGAAEANEVVSLAAKLDPAALRAVFADDATRP